MDINTALSTLDGVTARVASAQTPLWKKNRAALVVVRDALAAKDAEIARLTAVLLEVQEIGLAAMNSLPPAKQ